MKTTVIVLVLLVSVTRHAALQDEHGKVEDKSLTENEKYCQNHVCMELRELKQAVAELKVQLQENKHQTEQLKTENDALKQRLTSTEYAVENVKEAQANIPKVAFSAGSGYNGNYGPFNMDVIMVFSRVITNIGNAYSPNTGVFRAPVKGIYHFTFTVFGLSKTHYIGAKFFKNEQLYFQTHDLPQGYHESVTRSISLILEQADEVYLKLRANYQLYDDGNIYNMFGGFLLFPL